MCSAKLYCIRFFYPADPRGEQLSEDPGLALLYVCAALLFWVNVGLGAYFPPPPPLRNYPPRCHLFVSRLITLKVLNSIVLLGTSCAFVKDANMEEKLFDPPPSAVSSRVNSRAHRAKPPHTAATQQGSTTHQRHLVRTKTRILTRQRRNVSLVGTPQGLPGRAGFTPSDPIPDRIGIHREFLGKPLLLNPTIPPRRTYDGQSRNTLGVSQPATGLRGREHHAPRRNAPQKRL